MLNPKILHNHCLRSLLGRLQYPGETGNNGYVTFWDVGRGYYSPCENDECAD